MAIGRLSEMAAFVQVVNERSFSAAARRLGLSTAAVSRQIRSLEERLGVRLINRTSRSVCPTEVGRAFFDRCAAVLAEVEEAELAVTRLHECPRGTLRVNAPMSFGSLHLAPILPEFLACHPELHVEIALADRFIDVIEEGYDVAIRIGTLADSSLIAKVLAPCRRILCASPAYLAAHGIPSTPRDLKRHNCIGYTLERQARLRLGGTLRSDSGEVIRSAALAGVGIALLPTFLVGPDLHAGRLKRVPAPWLSADTTIHALYPHRRHLSAKVRLFVDFLARRFGPKPYWDRGEPPPAIGPNTQITPPGAGKTVRSADHAPTRRRSAAGDAGGNSHRACSGTRSRS